MALSTKNTNLSPTIAGTGISPIIKPGNILVTMRDIQIKKEKDPKYGDKLVMTVESKPLDIAKRLIIPNTQDQYQGQVGNVNYDRWGFRSNVTSGGFAVDRDTEIFKAIGIICRNLGLTAWWESKDGVYDTVDQVVEAFAVEKPFKDVWFYACVCGRPFLSANKQYTNYELFFPKDERNLGLPFHINEAKVIKFRESDPEHVVPMGNKAAPTQTELPINKDPQSSVVGNSPDVNAGKSEPDPNKPTPIVARTEQEKAFLNDGPQKVVETPFTDQVDKDIEEQRAALGVGAIKNNEECDLAPWDDGYEEWYKSRGLAVP